MSIDISNFNGSIGKIDYIFYSCSNLSYIDISGLHFIYGTYNVFDKKIPNNGIIKIRTKFAELIKDQIPSKWTIVKK